MSFTDTSVPKQYVIVQATEPTGAFEGQLWYNSSEDLTYIFQDDDWQLITLDISQEVLDLATENAQQQIDIIELQASATVTPFDHDTLISDTFSDADGYKDSVNTTNTTAIYEENKYKCIPTISTTEYTQTLLSSIPNYDDIRFKTGMQIEVKEECQIEQIKFDTWFNGKHCYISDENKTIISKVVVGTNPLVYTTPIKLLKGKKYFIELNHTNPGESNRVAKLETGLNYPYDNTYIKYISASVDTTSIGTGVVYCINNIVVKKRTYSTESIINIDLPTINGTITHTELVLNSKIGSGTIKYKLNNGTIDDTTYNLNQKNIYNLTGNPKKLKIILTPTTTNNEIKTYCLKLWKA